MEVNGVDFVTDSIQYKTLKADNEMLASMLKSEQEKGKDKDEQIKKLKAQLKLAKADLSTVKETSKETVKENKELAETIEKLRQEKIDIVRDYQLQLSQLEKNTQELTGEEKELKKSQAQLQKEWGSFVFEDYVFLEDRYDSYCQDSNIRTTSQKARLRDLCKAELRKRKMEEDGESTTQEYAQNSKEILDLLRFLKLDEIPKDENEGRDPLEICFERQIFEYENFMPAELEDLNMYKDYSGFHSKWSAIKRAVQNLCAGTRDFPKLERNEYFEDEEEE